MDSHDSPAERGVALRDILRRPVLEGARVVAGGRGLDRNVERLNVMEVPDILDWVKPREFLVTTAYPLRERPGDLQDLVASLDEAALSGLGIKLGRYLDEVPAAALAAAEERDFPLVVLPDDCSFDEILNDVLTYILSDQTARLERSEQIHRTFLQLVLDGRGVDAIAVELSDLLDAPTAIVDLDGTVLAGVRLAEATGQDEAPAWLDVSVETGHLRQGRDRVPVELAPVAAGPRLFGHVLAAPDRRPGEQRRHGHDAARAADDRLAVESAATVTALAMSLASEILAVESKYQSDLMHDLLTGRVANPGDALRRARSFGWDLDRDLITLVVQFDEPPEPVELERGRRRTPLAANLAPRLRERDPKAAVVRFTEEVVVLTAAFTGEDGRQEAKAFLADAIGAAAAATGMSVSGGLSRPVTSLAEIPRGYEQAVNAVTIGRRVHGHGHLAHFDELGAYRVLSLISDVDELRSFATEVLGELADDGEATIDLRHTLEVLLDTNSNVAETARRLHFHYNTLRYRIDKLERILGPFMSDAHVRLNVRLALLIHDMRGLEQP